ncbi:MAG: hypothetical protein V2G33_03100 [bacterium JZ-2024 1]
MKISAFLSSIVALFAVISAKEVSIFWTSDALKPYVPEGFDSLDPAFLKFRAFGEVFRESKIFLGEKEILLFLPFHPSGGKSFLALDRKNGKNLWDARLDCPPEYPKVSLLHKFYFFHQEGFFEVICENRERNSLSRVIWLNSKKEFRIIAEHPGFEFYELWAGELQDGEKVLFLRSRKNDGNRIFLRSFHSGTLLWESSLPLTRIPLHPGVKAPFFVHMFTNSLYQLEKGEKGIQPLLLRGFEEYVAKQPCAEPLHWTDGKWIFTKGKKCFSWGSFSLGLLGTKSNADWIEEIYPFVSSSDVVIVIRHGNKLTGFSLIQSKPLWIHYLFPEFTEYHYFPMGNSLWEFIITKESQNLYIWDPFQGKITRRITLPANLIDPRLPLFSVDQEYLLSLNLTEKKIILALLPLH